MGISVNELRIGNYVEWDANAWIAKDDPAKYELWETVQIIMLSTGSISLKNGKISDIDEIRPVLLTEDWLKKFKYEKQNELIKNRTFLLEDGDNGFDGSIEYRREYGSIFFYKNEYWLIIDENIDDYGINYTAKKIKYVHQFQNLCFALTEKELTLK